MIPVSRPYLPPRLDLDKYLDQIYSSNILTNNGPLVQELTKRLADYLNLELENLVLVANGSLALQLAYKALGISGQVITTPFSFIASSSTLCWEGLSPVFAEIDPETWNIDPDRIAEKVTAECTAILPVHVFGNPCEVLKIDEIAHHHGLRVIYDASHCFGSTTADETILKYGDISTVSFHATKLFHTVEGGLIIAKDRAVAAEVRRMINFGIDESGVILGVGINAKMSEFHAAVGLAVLDNIDTIRRQRHELWRNYQEGFSQSSISLQKISASSNINHAYFPVLFDSETTVLQVMDRLKAIDVLARRYFYPSLDNVGYLKDIRHHCEISNSICSRILCLPLFPGLDLTIQREIIKIVNETVGRP